MTTKVDLTPLDEAPVKPIHILAAVASLGGAFLDGYVLGIVGPALEIASSGTRLLAGLGPLGSGLIASSALIGVLIGGMFFGNVADRFGRRPVFAWNLGAFVVLSILQYFVTEAWQLVALRLLLGLMIGVEYAVGSAMLAEFSRRRGRGVLLGAFEVLWLVGFIAAFVTGNLYQGDNWRLLLLTSAIPALITFLLRTKLPESPLWLKSRGRTEEAEAIIEKHFGTGYSIPNIPSQSENPRLSEFFTRENWRRNVYAGLFWFCQVGPFFAIFTFLGPVFDGIGIESGLAIDFSFNLVQLAGGLLGLLLIHLLARRTFVISTFSIMFAALLIVGLFPHAPIWITILLFGIYCFIAPASNNIERVYPAEIFDTRLRATGTGFAAGLSRLSAAAATFLLPAAIDAFGTSSTLVILAMFPLVGLVFSILWAPETKGKHLG